MPLPWLLSTRRAMRTLCNPVLRAAAALAMLASTTTSADMWRYPPEIATRSFSHGDVRVVLTTDARADQVSPDFLFEVFKGDAVVARIPGISFDSLFASNDNRVFLGVFADTGRLALLADHGLAEFDYCTKSVTLERVWFDEADPNVRFQLDDKQPDPGIFIRSCRGHDIEILRTVRQAFARAGEKAAARQ